MKGSFGTLKLGTHDTPLKLAQLKADLFNDLKGDIKNITDGENKIKRKSFVLYSSFPSFITTNIEKLYVFGGKLSLFSEVIVLVV